ncbi:MAG: YgjV family protein [Methanobrevibacter sp.]|nr:YgjV family protein [Methanobrevibacter sp.]
MINGIDISTLIAIITGIIAIIFNITSVLINKKILIIFTLLSNIFFTIHFLMLYDYAAVFSCITISLSALIIYVYHSIDRETPEIILILFIFLFLLAGHLDKHIDLDGHGILPILASIFILFGLENKNIRMSRLYFLICAIFWIIYDLYSPLLYWNNIINQVLLIIFIIIAFLIHDVLNKKIEKKLMN